MTNKIMYWHELTLTLTSLLIVNNCITNLSLKGKMWGASMLDCP